MAGGFGAHGEEDQFSERRGFSAVSVGMAMAGTVIAAYILSWIYGPLEHYSPIIYLNLLVTYGMGWLVGKAAQAAIKKKRINTPIPAFLIGAFAGLFAVWFSWATYIWTIAEYNFTTYFEVLSSPAFLLHLIEYIAHEPLWTIGKGGSAGPAVMYYAVWAGEAAIIAGKAGMMGLEYVRRNLLCGKCGEWVRETGDIAFFEHPDGGDTEHVRVLSAGDISSLPGLARRHSESETTEWLEAKGHACANCPAEDSLVSVAKVEMRLNKKTKKLERSEKILTRFVGVGVDMERTLFEHADAAVAAGMGDSEDGGAGEAASKRET